MTHAMCCRGTARRGNRKRCSRGPQFDEDVRFHCVPGLIDGFAAVVFPENAVVNAFCQALSASD